MSRTAPALASLSRAYASGRCAALRPPSPLQQHRVAAALAQAAPEVVAAYRAGVAADPREPMPESVLAAVVARLARQSVEELPEAGPRLALAGTTAGPVQPAPGRLGQSGDGGTR